MEEINIINKINDILSAKNTIERDAKDQIRKHVKFIRNNYKKELENDKIQEIVVPIADKAVEDIYSVLDKAIEVAEEEFEKATKEEERRKKRLENLDSQQKRDISLEVNNALLKINLLKDNHKEIAKLVEQYKDNDEVISMIETFSETLGLGEGTPIRSALAERDQGTNLWQSKQALRNARYSKALSSITRQDFIGEFISFY